MVAVQVEANVRWDKKNMYSIQGGTKKCRVAAVLKQTFTSMYDMR